MLILSPAQDDTLRLPSTPYVARFESRVAKFCFVLHYRWDDMLMQEIGMTLISTVQGVHTRGKELIGYNESEGVSP